jgi:hypothetical protein
MSNSLKLVTGEIQSRTEPESVPNDDLFCFMTFLDTLSQNIYYLYIRLENAEISSLYLPGFESGIMKRERRPF